ncbi:Kef-type K+ transport system, membrane component KefB [Amycolatopsis xylanica]|uniref:Kef-type K+ transport system, membrane component KefB n=1 Tax=Amycolatopsis xylanica TaxID=589385 RepID=A0A1H2VUH2_9PSEU|nr:cation:proton antiporter [Amycolatopsis xylanica]SDW71887.1 Kef-type K+ transport system, membrane component KefB [Amycolatopsis xylanica]
MTTTESAEPRAAARFTRFALPYALMVVVPAVLAVVLLRTGGGFDTAGGQRQPGSADLFGKLLFVLPVVFLACRLLTVVAKRLWQPAVIGEIFAGVLLGPSFLGWVWPSGFAWLFPASLTSTINVLAQVGLVLFMFLIGYEVDAALIRRRSDTVVLVSHAGILLPFLAGTALALGMYGPLGGTANRLAFSLFLAVSLSVTAFPVMARILVDRRMMDRPIAAFSLGCAAITDVTAWCLLVLVVAIANGTSLAAIGWTVLLAAVFFLVMTMLVRPLLRWLVAREPSGAVLLPALLAGLVLAALATNEIGIHPIFGAFLFGVITPRGALVVRRVTGEMHGLTSALLLPLFFVYTGLSTDFGLLGSDWTLWAWCALLTVVAIVTKWGGSLLAARLGGMGWLESFSVGALMNCRGLTELVVLTIGLRLHVITPTVFAMLVLMTLVSTVMTAPALTLADRLRRRGQDRRATAG